MADEPNTPDAPEQNGGAPLTSQIQIGVDWGSNTVVMAPEGMPAIGIPILVYLQTSMSIMVQMMERLQQDQRGKIEVIGANVIPDISGRGRRRPS